MHVKLPYQCNLCTRSFSRFEHLQVHQQIHTVKQLYMCNLCNRSFDQREQLRRHLSVHNFINLHAT
ncbi:unnamed protein product [Onchocerca flexuosa]|uniref:Zinc finger, C2H2 type n=1 Tax=Onchocerca flexuosa TaxID=387005 RepID=A0A183HVZ0_9BILA|nr:unnamed protein product [Onchocerca flexuosa]